MRSRRGGYEGSKPIGSLRPPPPGPGPGAGGSADAWTESAPGKLWCARCLLENFTHDSGDPHILHGPTCAPVTNKEAVTIMGGRALCTDHALDQVSEEW